MVPVNSRNIMDRYQKNFSKSLELIDICFNLEEAYLKKIHPQASQKDINNIIFQGILSRKKRQWRLQKALLKH